MMPGMNKQTFQTGDRVRFREAIEAGDEAAEFIVVELRGERVLVRDANSKLAIAPQCVYLISELEEVLL